MKKILVLFSLLGSGVFAGWHSHSLYALFSKKESVSLNSQTERLPPSKNSPDLSTKIKSPGFFSGKDLLNNTQLGMVIELIKQDLDIESQQQLNKEVVQYANSLLANEVNADNAEQRLLALLGNYDTREDVLDILARFYERQKEYKKAVSSLYNLRSMVQFDDEYNKITNRIKVVSRKNIKLLESYNYKSEIEDFYDFLVAKEPDNFAIQMEYAEFEYKNRKYAHVDELLSVLRHHPDYVSQSEILMQKAIHQKDMIENGIIPVPVEKAGEHYVVTAVINNQEPVKLIIDTGATLTILSPKVIQELGLRVDDVRQYMEFSTANGVVQAPVVSIDTMSVRNHLVRDLQVGVLSAFPHSKFAGLLGMNFLSQFEFFIDQKNSTLELVDID